MRTFAKRKREREREFWHVQWYSFLRISKCRKLPRELSVKINLHHGDQLRVEFFSSFIGLACVHRYFRSRREEFWKCNARAYGTPFAMSTVNYAERCNRHDFAMFHFDDVFCCIKGHTMIVNYVACHRSRMLVPVGMLASNKAETKICDR